MEPQPASSQPEPDTDTAEPDAAGSYEEMCKRAAGSNVHEETLLATDYLNHFNEVIMLLEMLPDMPDILEEVKAWQPKSYEQHFIDSGLSIGELAIAAYALAPPRHRVPFDQTVGQMNRVVLHAIERLDKAVATNDEQALRLIARGTTHALQRLNEAASGIIHGSEKTMEQAEIDDLLAEAPADADADAGGQDQADIDAMFADDGGDEAQADIDALLAGDEEQTPADDDGAPEAPAEPAAPAAIIASARRKPARNGHASDAKKKRDPIAEELSEIDIDALFDRRGA